MSDSMWIQGKEYISSKRASELSGYAQDYIGQLARKGLIGAQRVGGLWFVSMTSLTEYKSHADTYVPQPPEKKDAPDPDSLVSFDGKDHVSAARAAKITGYHPDYVGQLARSGAIISRQVGNRWYVDRAALLAHKKEKDSLLGAVQAQSVGLGATRPASAESAPAGVEPNIARYSGPGPFLTYTSDSRELLPTLAKSKPAATLKEQQYPDYPEQEADQEYPVAIHKIRTPMPSDMHPPHLKPLRTPKKARYYGTYRSLATAALTIVIVLSFGFVTLKNSSVYSGNTTPGGAIIQKNMLAGAASAAFEWITGFTQNFLVKELIYRRGQ